MTVPAHREKTHVLTLDSIRGIAAVTVVVHHVVLMPTFLAAFPNRAWVDCPFFRSGGFLVDLFFVLSGIVMSLSYVQSDFGQFSVRDFMVRRLARVYPLHIVMLVVLLLFRLMRIGLVAAGIIAVAQPEFEVNNAYSFLLNVFLLQSVGIVHYLNWNAPSWSISVEFYTYLVFGIVVLIAQRLRSLRWLYGLAAVLVAGSWLMLTIVLGKRDLEVQYDFGLLRCFTSFFLGVLTVKTVALLPDRVRAANTYWLGAFQLMCVIAALAHVWFVEAYPWISLAAPLTFAVLLGSLLAFPQAAIVPSILTAKPLLWLGERSYSIYMVHAFVVLLSEYFVRALGKRPVAALDSVWVGLPTTLNLIVILAAVLALSNLTYRYVELPGGRLVRNILGRNPSMSSSAVVPSARPSN